jgi:hypothetical protein
MKNKQQLKQRANAVDKRKKEKSKEERTKQRNKKTKTVENSKSHDQSAIGRPITRPVARRQRGSNRGLLSNTPPQAGSRGLMDPSLESKRRN